MKNIKGALLAISAGLAALGIVLMGTGFALGGFNPHVFMMNVDADKGVVQLGNKTIDNPEDIPLLNMLTELDASGAPGEPDAPDAPEAPSSPEAPASGASPASPESPASGASPTSPEEPASPKAPSGSSSNADSDTESDSSRTLSDAYLPVITGFLGGDTALDIAFDMMEDVA